MLKAQMNPLEKALAVYAYTKDDKSVDYIAEALKRNKSTIYEVLRAAKVMRKPGPRKINAISRSVPVLPQSSDQ